MRNVPRQPMLQPEGEEGTKSVLDGEVLDFIAGNLMSTSSESDQASYLTRLEENPRSAAQIIDYHYLNRGVERATEHFECPVRLRREDRRAAVWGVIKRMKEIRNNGFGAPKDNKE